MNIIVVVLKSIFENIYLFIAFYFIYFSIVLLLYIYIYIYIYCIVYYYYYEFILFFIIFINSYLKRHPNVPKLKNTFSVAVSLSYGIRQKNIQ